MPSRFQGKVAIVTGATSGIGAAAAWRLAAEGATVVLAGRREDRGIALVEHINEAGGTAQFVRTDVTHRDDLSQLVEHTMEEFGKLDLAFNNAGIAGTAFTRAADIAEDQWDEVIAVNLTSVWLSMKHEIPAMLASGGGSIVNNASSYALRGSDFGSSDYVAAKHGVLGLTRTAAIDYAPRGIRINALCPGYTHSEIVDPLLADNPGTAEQIQRRVPMARIADPEEVAAAALWLLSDEASFVTGQALTPDGGLTAH